MDAQKFEKTLTQVKKVFNVELPKFFDKEHLLPMWFGGHVANINFDDGYTVEIAAEGVVSIAGIAHGTPFVVCDRDNKREAYKKIAHLVNDVSVKRKTKTTLYIDSLNHFAAKVITPDGNIFCPHSNILSGNLLDVLSDTSLIIRFAEEARLADAREAVKEVLLPA